ncbi:hypothetical protein FE257_011889 [Aspergillus nanangensis]|uniref:Carboxymuconolactone decarboxylase-like domain-containing protein n=1 Tax=Aspergillus nanangensis TaxID=2582783 RepID=A0AAD4CGW9_ASPNN|nr:hypothetical protein FE257_011889 [Aspergillus nanangensis]
MRLPYAPTTPPDESTDTTRIYSRIAARRNPRPLIPLDLTLLHSPPVADGYNSFVGALRTETIVDSGLLELAICRVAVLNQAVYEWNIHAPLAYKAQVSPAVLQDSLALPPWTKPMTTGWEDSGLNVQQRAVLQYTDQMTKLVTVDDEVFSRLGEFGFSEREIVELTATIAGYNCVSRILVALDVGENNARPMKTVGDIVAETSC